MRSRPVKRESARRAQAVSIAEAPEDGQNLFDKEIPQVYHRLWDYLPRYRRQTNLSIASSGVGHVNQYDINSG